MRSYKRKDQFFSKMKKKPAVQAVLDNIDAYSEEDLLSLRGNQFPKWIREELVKYKNRDGKSPELMAQIFAAKMREQHGQNKES